MSQERGQQNTTGGLAKLPFDVLLDIFNGCDVADILNLALVSKKNRIQGWRRNLTPIRMPQTCKDLRTATEERHVWLTQFKRSCTAFRQAPFHSRTKELHIRSTAQLKSWTIQQACTDALWLQNEGTDDDLKLQHVVINDPENLKYLGIFLLPGGEHLVALTIEGIILKKIERGNEIGDPEWVLSDVARCSPPSPEAECIDMVFTDTVCEYPLIAFGGLEDPKYATFHEPLAGIRHSQEFGLSITIFRLDYDSQAISLQKEIQVNPGVMDYLLGRLSIRGDTIFWSYMSYDDDLRGHLIVAKLDDPDGAATRYLDLDRHMVGDDHSCS